MRPSTPQDLCQAVMAESKKVLRLAAQDARREPVKMGINGGAATEVAGSVIYGCDMTELAKMTNPCLIRENEYIPAKYLQTKNGWSNEESFIAGHTVSCRKQTHCHIDT